MLQLEEWVGMLRSGAASKQMVQALAGPRYWPSVEALLGGGKFNVDGEHCCDDSFAMLLSLPGAAH
jgi:hypothetical protein